jgi:hypothetical protein
MPQFSLADQRPDQLTPIPESHGPFPLETRANPNHLAARTQALPTWATVSGAIIGAAIWFSAFVVFLPYNGGFLDTLNFLANTIRAFWLLTIAVLL